MIKLLGNRDVRRNVCSKLTAVAVKSMPAILRHRRLQSASGKRRSEVGPPAVTSTFNEELLPPARCEAFVLFVLLRLLESSSQLRPCLVRLKPLKERSVAERPSVPTHTARINERGGVG